MEASVEPTRTSWWFRLGAEDPLPAEERCPVGGCPPPDAIDLFCPADHADAQFLLFQGREGMRKRWLIANALRVVAGLLFVVAAQWETVVPLLVGVAAVGVAAIAMPLRAYRATVRVAVAAWLVSLVAVAVTSAVELHGDARAVLWLVPIGVVVLAALVFALLGPLRIDVPDLALGRPAPTQAIAIGLMTSPIALAAWWLSRSSLVESLVDLPAVVSAWLLGSAFGGLAGTGLVAIVAGVIRASRTLDKVVAQRFAMPRQRGRIEARPVKRPAPLAGRQLPDRILASVQAFSYRLTVVMVRYRTALKNFAVRTGYRFHRTMVTWMNRAHAAAVRQRRRLVGTVRHASSVLAGGGRVALATARRFVKGVAPVGIVVVAAVAATAGADRLLGYLVTGAFADLGALAVAFPLAMAALLASATVWVTGARRRSGVEQVLTAGDVVRSAVRTTANVAPEALLLFVGGAWAIGLPGLFGIGPIRPGWVTVTTTVLLVVAWVWGRVRSDGPIDLRTAPADGGGGPTVLPPPTGPVVAPVEGAV